MLSAMIIHKSRRRSRGNVRRDEPAVRDSLEIRESRSIEVAPII
jgi:hypothetical protein